MSDKDPVGMHKLSRKLAKENDWTNIVLCTNADLFKLGEKLNWCLAFKPDDFVNEKEISDSLAKAFIALYTITYKFGSKEVMKSLKETVEKKNEFYEQET